MKRHSDANSGDSKRQGALLVVSLALALGPLIGAIWSMVGFMLQREEMRQLHQAGKPITQEPRLQPLPILIGFVAFPIGVLMLTRATLWFSRHIREDRARRST